MEYPHPSPSLGGRLRLPCLVHDLLMMERMRGGSEGYQSWGLPRQCSFQMLGMSEGRTATSISKKQAEKLLVINAAAQAS